MWTPKIKINLLPPLRFSGKKRPRLINDIWRQFRETDRAIHDRINREFPRTVRIVDNMLGTFLAIVSNPLFAIIVALVLVPLVTSETISLVNALSIGGAWVVAVAWLARSAPLKDFLVPSRFLIVVLLAAVLAAGGIKFGHWSTTKWKVHHQDAVKSEPQAKDETPKVVEPVDKPPTPSPALKEHHKAKPPSDSVPEKKQVPDTPAPQLEQVRVISVRDIPSTSSDAAFGLEIALQTSVPLQPILLNIKCSSEIAYVLYSPTPNYSGMVVGGANPANEDKTVAVVNMESPAFVPQYAMIVKIFSKEKNSFVSFKYLAGHP
jgi:hypothetical protein